MSVSVGGPSKATAGGGDATTDTDPDVGVRRTAIAPPSAAPTMLSTLQRATERRVVREGRGVIAIS